ncbi:MAG TPA: Gfo/Idh/MocA family oxidoreductase [Candidatus Nanoarchaeia archaeon]|nr:Gfo/Idh/MocA family oxidoreductase [Candidatus Nanoarchaeia archaeon]
MEIKNILLIGAGQIGSRHLQALAKIDFPISILVIDPSEDSLRRSKERYEEITSNGKVITIKFSQNMDFLPSEVDLCIVATATNVRAKVIKEIMTHRKIKYFLLEKVLFQSLAEYKEISALFKANRTKAWVNCPRRIMPFYQGLKDIFSKDKIIFLTVSGGNWGLGSNLIHYLDYFSYLVGKSNFKLKRFTLDQRVFPSKRAGFNELSGSFFAGNPGGSQMILFSNPDSYAPTIETIQCNSAYVIIDDRNKKVIIAREENNWQPETRDFIIPFQSDLTQQVVKEILTTGTCGLTYFSESSRLHQFFLKELIKHQKRINGGNNDFCNIT